jgi:hypothetical protein
MGRLRHGTFSNGQYTITGTTDANGQVSETFTANTRAGTYSVTASAAGASTPAKFSLTNDPGPAATITATSGGGQSATVGTAFAAPLVATVTDQNGNPVSGVSVTFTASASGAGGTFNGSATITGMTGANGQVSETFTASTLAGTYSVTASVAGVSTPASFSLTNKPKPGSPATITATSGGGQSATVGSAFAAPLVATVTDQNGNPVSGVSVTFTAPASGAGGTFSTGQTTITGTTDANGQVSATFTANTRAGTYSVTASVAGVSTPASFSLTNKRGARTTRTARVQLASSTPTTSTAGPRVAPGGDPTLAPVLARPLSDSTGLGPAAVSVVLPVAQPPAAASGVTSPALPLAQALLLAPPLTSKVPPAGPATDSPAPARASTSAADQVFASLGAELSSALFGEDLAVPRRS